MKIAIDKLHTNTGQVKGVPKNPRFIKDDKYNLLKKSLQEDPEFMDYNPILIYDNKTELIVMGGNMRVRAAKELGWKEIEGNIMPHDTPPEVIRARIIKHNSGYGSDDWDLLANEWSDDPLEDWGMDMPDSWKEEAEIEEDEAPEVSSEPPVSQLGSIYQLGRHRVMCGDSTDTEQLNELLQGVKPELLFTDPPYKFETQGGGVLKNSRQMNEVKANGVNEFDPTTLEAQCRTNIYFHNKSLIGDYVQLSKDWAMAYDLAIYKKPGLPNWSGHLMTDIEYIAIIGQLDPNKGMDMPMYSKVYEGKKDQDNELSYSKPIELCAKFIKLYSQETVLDTFLGSGSTLIACEQTDRTCYGMELDPKYVDVIRKRYAKFTNNNELPDNWEELTPVVQ